jgi:hypothetical protein
VAEHETFREQTLRIAAAMLENPAPVVEAVAALMEFNERQEPMKPKKRPTRRKALGHLLAISHDPHFIAGAKEACTQAVRL